jgi:hypothetical protein
LLPSAAVLSSDRCCDRGYTAETHSCLSDGQILGKHRGFMSVHLVQVRHLHPGNSGHSTRSLLYPHSYSTTTIFGHHGAALWLTSSLMFLECSCDSILWTLECLEGRRSSNRSIVQLEEVNSTHVALGVLDPAVHVNHPPTVHSQQHFMEN